MAAKKEPDFVPPFKRCEWREGCPFPGRIHEPYGKYVCVDCYSHAIDPWRANRDKDPAKFAPDKPGSIYSKELFDALKRRFA